MGQERNWRFVAADAVALSHDDIVKDPGLGRDTDQVNTHSLAWRRCSKKGIVGDQWRCIPDHQLTLAVVANHVVADVEGAACGVLNIEPVTLPGLVLPDEIAVQVGARCVDHGQPASRAEFIRADDAIVCDGVAFQHGVIALVQIEPRSTAATVTQKGVASNAGL